MFVALRPAWRIQHVYSMHGLHHPPVVVHVPTIECECMSDNREACVVTPSHVRELAGACELISNVHGLHAGFEYKSLVHWSLGDEQATQQFDMVFSASSDSYDVRVSLGIFRRFRTGGAFVFDVNVLDSITHLCCWCTSWKRALYTVLGLLFVII